MAGPPSDRFLRVTEMKTPAAASCRSMDTQIGPYGDTPYRHPSAALPNNLMMA